MATSFRTTLTNPVLSNNNGNGEVVFRNQGIPLTPPIQVETFEARSLDKAKELIQKKHANIGSLLGNAVSDVQMIDNLSFVYFQNFETGCIIVNRNNSVFEIHGVIYMKWNEMGRASYGLPLTDEMSTPDRIGRYNHFTDGKSIYWHPSTGAHAIYGAIRTLWSENGWETSSLGYPTSDEMAAPDGVGRISNFQHGSIYCSSNTGTYILQDSCNWTESIVTGGLTALGGSWEIIFYRSGNFIFRGHLHNSGLDNYDSQLAVAIIDSLGIAYTFENKGHTSTPNFYSSGSPNNDWVNSGSNPIIAQNWGQMQHAAHYAVFNYDSAIATAVGDAVNEALKKLVEAGIQVGVNAIIALVS